MNKLFNDAFRVGEKIEAGFTETKQEEEPKDEIMAAARHVEKVVDMKGMRRLSFSSSLLFAHSKKKKNQPYAEIDAKTPEGRLYLASRRIAEEMALMSQAAARGANSEVPVPYMTFTML